MAAIGWILGYAQINDDVMMMMMMMLMTMIECL